jgi:hypothetical protein
VTTRFPRGLILAIGGGRPQHKSQEQYVFRDIILWLAGVPIVVIILLHLIGALH